MLNAVRETLSRLPAFALLAALSSCASSGADANTSSGGGTPLAGAGGSSGSSTGGAPGAGAGGSVSAGTANGGATNGGGMNGGAAGASAVGGSASGQSGTGGSDGGAGGLGGSGGLAEGGFSGSGGSAGQAGSGGSAGAIGGAGGKGGAGAAGSAGATTWPKFAGNITTRGQVRSDFVDYWDQITPENEGKWGSVEGQRDRMNWAGMDRVRDYARDHNIPYKGHALIWGAQQPGWVAGLSESEQRAEVEEWIQQFCERYPDVALVDVVNEPPPHTTPSYLNALGGAGASGYDWIVQAFVWAHQYCPNAVLILNDYGNIEGQNDNNHTIDMVNKIKAAGAPISAVGAQAHGASRASTATVEMYINRIASMTNLPVYITEYDIDLADDNQQRDVMQSQFTMFWNNANVKGVTLWGYVVGATWRPNTGLLSSSGQERPALTWLKDFLGR